MVRCSFHLNANDYVHGGGAVDVPLQFRTQARLPCNVLLANYSGTDAMTRSLEMLPSAMPSRIGFVPKR